MLNYNNIEEIILNNFKKYNLVCQAIYVFGSALNKKYFNDKSDIDIAILLSLEESKKIKNFYFTDLLEEISKELNREIDLINLRNVSTVFQKEIISKGLCIYSDKTCAKNEFEGMTFSFYQKLNEERNEILKNFSI